ERLQGMALQRKAHAGERSNDRSVARRDDADLLRQDSAARRAYARNGAVLAQDARHLAVLDDVDAEAVGGARITPGHRIVPRNTGAALQGGSKDRIPGRAGDLEDRTERLH